MSFYNRTFLRHKEYSHTNMNISPTAGKIPKFLGQQFNLGLLTHITVELVKWALKTNTNHTPAP